MNVVTVNGSLKMFNCQHDFSCRNRRDTFLILFIADEPAFGAFNLIVECKLIFHLSFYCWPFLGQFLYGSHFPWSFLPWFAWVIYVFYFPHPLVSSFIWSFFNVYPLFGKCCCYVLLFIRVQWFWQNFWKLLCFM